MSSKILSGYHDAELTSVEVNRGSKEVLLKFKLASDVFQSISFRNVTLFRATDFIMQNVVSRLHLFEGREVDVSRIASYLKWVSSLNDSSSFLSDDNMEKNVHKIRGGVLKMLVLEPSWGSEIVMVFETMEETLAS